MSDQELRFGDGGEGEAESPGGISTDQLFFTLSNERRRHALECLRERGGTVAMRELVREVAARERDVAPDDLTYDQRKSVYVSLRQTHLPKMDTLGIVEFDPDAGTIDLVDGIADFDFYYEPVRADDVGWGEFTVGLAALLAVVVGATTAGVFPFDLVPAGALPWLVVAAFGTVGAVQAYLTRQRRLGIEFPWLGRDGSTDRHRDGE